MSLDADLFLLEEVHQLLKFLISAFLISRFALTFNANSNIIATLTATVTWSMFYIIHIDLLKCVFLSGPIGTSLAFQSSHLNKAFLYYLPGSLSPYFSYCFRRQEPSFSDFFVIVSLFKNMYELLSSIYRKHSTAWRNQPCTKQQSKYVPTRTRQRKQAG